MLFLIGIIQIKDIIMKLQIEIRPGEGGDDARLLLRDQASIYIKFAEKKGIKVDVIDETLG